MAVDYTITKPTVGSTSGENYPTHTKDADWQRLEPLVTPQEVREVHLFGIPLVSRVKDPVSGEYARMTDAILRRFIEQAVAQVEEETHLSLLPVQRQERLAYDYLQQHNLGYMRLSYRPVASIEYLGIQLVDGSEIFDVPIEWVDTAHLDKGQLNLVPISIVASSDGSNATAGAFLVLLNKLAFIPSYWQARYTTGFIHGLLPQIANYLVGVVAAINALSRLAATDVDSTSASLGMDGISQSSGGPGPQKYVQRLKELAEDRARYTGKLRARYGSKFTMGHV